MEEHIRTENGAAILSINPKIYPLAAIYSAAYIFLDKAYIILDGEPEKEVIVRLKPKEGYEPKQLGLEFFNELINYADYRERAEHTRRIREIFLQRSLITNDPGFILDVDNSRIDADSSGTKEDSLRLGQEQAILDQEQAIPWEEKYAVKEKKGKNADKAE
jgi:His-Xaa-Ser system protein HxsD